VPHPFARDTRSMRPKSARRNRRRASPREGRRYRSRWTGMPRSIASTTTRAERLSPEATARRVSGSARGCRRCLRRVAAIAHWADAEGRSRSPAVVAHVATRRKIHARTSPPPSPRTRRYAFDGRWIDQRDETLVRICEIGERALSIGRNQKEICVDSRPSADVFAQIIARHDHARWRVSSNAVSPRPESKLSGPNGSVDGLWAM
jgi:hypothetical protein